MRTFLHVLSLSIAAVIAMAPPPAYATDGNKCGLRPLLGRGERLRIYALTTGQRLVTFRECNPRRVKDVGAIGGLGGSDTALVGIDFRVQDGKLYGVGNGGGVYTLDLGTGAATLVNQLSVALDGAQFGVDFNPAADRLRIVSDTGQNLRHNVNAGGVTLVDGTLNYAAGTPAAGVSGAAYTNNDLDPNTGTTLFDLDATLDQIVLQSPPNAGSLVATGKLEVDADAPVGFDIFTDVDDDAAFRNRGFASLVAGGVSGFYRVNLLTGSVASIGEFPQPIIDVAIPLD